jgi:hypothetical protein
LLQWDDRLAEVRTLAGSSSSDAFAQAAADNRFGPIDVFVLKEKDGLWYFRDVAFSPEQFAPSHFVVTPGLANHTVVAVRTR